jgi:hypothetical protein
MEDRDETKVETEEERRRRKFASAMARAEFGRHYWDDHMQTDRRRDRKREKPKKGGNG